MVRLLERPVTAREAEGRIQTAQLLKWLQYSFYTPSTAESRLLQLGVDELFGRTVDMTAFAVAFSVRLWSGWMRMSFRKRWLFPAYAALVISDRRRSMNTLKYDSTYATLAAISQLDSPLGREAKRLIEQSQPRLEKFKKTAHAQKLDYQVARYLRQVFYLYAAFGPNVGAAISHLCLWHTFHDTFEGSAFLHTFVPGEEDDFSMANELQQQQIIEEVLKAKKEKNKEGTTSTQKKSTTNTEESSTSSSQRIKSLLERLGWSSGTAKVVTSDKMGLTTKTSTTVIDTTGDESDNISSSNDDDETVRKMLEEKKKELMEEKEKRRKELLEQHALSTIWINAQLNFRWFKWQAFEISSVAADDARTLAFSFGFPAIDDRNDFIANELRKCRSTVTLNWWFPARLWWKLRWTGVSLHPPAPTINE